MPEAAKHSLWMGIAERIVSFLIVFAVAFIWVGSTRQKVSQKVTTMEADLAAWKEEWKAEKAHITSMDLEGSIATKNFIQNYNKEQSQQYKQLDELQKQVNHLEMWTWRIKKLEGESRNQRKQDDTDSYP